MNSHLQAGHAGETRLSSALSIKSRAERKVERAALIVAVLTRTAKCDGGSGGGSGGEEDGPWRAFFEPEDS